MTSTAMRPWRSASSPASRLAAGSIWSSGACARRSRSDVAGVWREHGHPLALRPAFLEGPAEHEREHQGKHEHPEHGLGLTQEGEHARVGQCLQFAELEQSHGVRLNRRAGGGR